MNRLQLNGRKPSSLDKIRQHYLEGKKLPEKLEEKRLQYESANTYRVAGYSKEQVVALLMETNMATSRATAYTIVRDSEALFGDINKSNKDGLRHILTENFLAVYRKAWNNDDLKECNRALDSIAKINQLYDTTESGIDWKKVVIPVPVFMTDPKILEQQQTNDATEYTVN